MKTMICLILDRSGSMAGRESDVIGGVNNFIDEQKKLPDPASIAFVRFDTEAVERFRPMQALAEVKPLEAGEYQPRGGTPLLDAIGKTIAHLEEDWKAEKPDRAIVVIVTDGQENSSHEYTKAKVKDLIESRQKSGLWAFVYLGANVDAFAEAGSMGILAANSAGYANTAKGTARMYATMDCAVTEMRQTGRMTASNLGKNIGEDEDQQPQPLAPAPQQASPAQPWTPPQMKVWTPPN